jgi:RimJ/RimL family protein N-acetyltransferase
MKDNWTSTIISEKLQLVPYARECVPKYHSWMQSEEMQELTASEPLSLDEEFEMQATWRDDPKKCTFIILSHESEDLPHVLSSGDSALVDRMIGDVNIFLHDRDDPGNAEIEIMTAEKNYSRKGIATEALNLMMIFGAKHLGVHRYFAKINKSNTPSISLFHKLGYKEVNYVEAFQEYEFELNVSEELILSLLSKCGGSINIVPFAHV